MGVIQVSIPKQLQHSLFFDKDFNEILVEDAQLFHLKEPFLYEILFYHSIDGYKPWVSFTECIPVVVNKWEEWKVEIGSLFEHRKSKATLEPMKQGISLFIQFLCWANTYPVVLNPTIPYKELRYKPVNVEERLEFLMKRPNLYHSFVQLSELFLEMQKQYARKLVLEKASKS